MVSHDLVERSALFQHKLLMIIGVKHRDILIFMDFFFA